MRRLYPAAFDPTVRDAELEHILRPFYDLDVGCLSSASMAAADSHITLATDTIKREVVIFDGPVGAWTDTVITRIRRRSCQPTAPQSFNAGSEAEHIKKDLFRLPMILLETDDLRNVSPSALCDIVVVQLPSDEVGSDAVASACVPNEYLPLSDVTMPILRSLFDSDLRPALALRPGPERGLR